MKSPVTGLTISVSSRKLHSKPTRLSISGRIVDGHNNRTFMIPSQPPKSLQGPASKQLKPQQGGLLMTRQKALAPPPGGSGGGEGGKLTAKHIVQRRRNESARNLTEMPKDMVEVAPHLIECNLSCNALKEIPKVFFNSQDLESLDFTDNRITELKSFSLKPSTSGSFLHLSCLKLSLNPVKEVPMEIFFLPDLHELSLHHCKIDKISFPDGSKADVQIAPLQMLDISANNLESLPPVNVFPKLTTLRASENKLRVLPSLENLKNLRELTVNNNLLETFPALVPSLRSVDLSANRLTSVPGSAFSLGCDCHIQNLLLQKNAIESVPAGLFAYLPFAKVIDLTENRLATIPPLDHVVLEGFYCGANRLTSVKIKEVPALQYLDLSRNALEYAPDNLSALEDLRMLGLSFNPLKEAPKELPKQIQDLHMASCGLKSLPVYGLEKVEVLCLHSNELSSLRFEDIFKPEALKTLKFVDVSHNFLNEAEVTSALAKSSELELHAKPRSPRPADSEWGDACTCGRRKTMEDAEFEFKTGNLRVFGLFDGHGGSDVSRKSCAFVREYLGENLPGKCVSDEDSQLIISRSFEEANKQFSVTDLEHMQGSTALVCVIVNNERLHCGSIGDSRAVLRRKDGSVVRLSFDHKPREWSEHHRVHATGGYVTPEGRVQGLLSVARALGDKALAPYVSSEPYLASHNVADGDFIIIACDGIWDVVSDEEGCRVVSESLARFNDASMASAALRDYAYLNGSGDNISVLVAKCIHN